MVSNINIEQCTFTENTTLDGLKKALKHCTKYEDRMYLQFLIRKEMAKTWPNALYGVESLV